MGNGIKGYPKKPKSSLPKEQSENKLNSKETRFSRDFPKKEKGATNYS